MKVKTLSALAGAATAMLLSGAADAAFTGLQLVATTHVAQAGDLGLGTILPGTSLTRYQVFAVFNNAGDALTSVYGNDDLTPGGGTPMTIENRNATDTGAGLGFFNNTLGGNTAPNPALFGLSASLPFDTYLTIGREPGAASDPTQFSPGFPSPFAGTTNNENISWFDPVITPASTAGADMRVMLGQFTVRTGENVRGTFGLTYRPSGATADLFVQNVSFNTVPAPGALALLGLAGLVGTRRRRA